MDCSFQTGRAPVSDDAKYVMENVGYQIVTRNITNCYISRRRMIQKDDGSNDQTLSTVSKGDSQVVYISTVSKGDSQVVFIISFKLIPIFDGTTRTVTKRNEDQIQQ